MNILESELSLIGLDIGTSAIKGVLTDGNADILAESERRTCLTHPQEGWTELDPDQHYQDVCAVIRELAAQAPSEVSALAMSGASGNTLLTDHSGQPLTNIISWMDNRAEQNPPRILRDLTSEHVRSVTGWPCVTLFPIGHLAWLQENEPEVYRQAAHCCMNTDWLIYRLTGQWVMDYSTAASFHLQNQVSRKYHQPFLDMLGIDEARLSRLVDSGVSVGNLTEQAQEDTGVGGAAIIATGCFDHPAAARGVGVTESGQLMLSCGTSWVGFFPESDRQKIIDLELLCDPFLHSQGGPWGAIFSVPYIGRTIDWYVDHLIAPECGDKYRVFDDLAESALPGAEGLTIDLREPPEHIDADRKNISRAVMESAAKLLNERINVLREQGVAFNNAVMVGGPSKSPIWPEIVEQITGLSITRGSQSAGAKGAALLTRNAVVEI